MRGHTRGEREGERVQVRERKSTTKREREMLEEEGGGGGRLGKR